jgi:hypothetical protein
MKGNPLLIPRAERNDFLKYPFLNQTARFDTLGDKLHKDLQHSLKANNYEYMTEI